MPAKSAGFYSGKNVNGVAHIVHKRGGYSEENERKHMKKCVV
jgi:hypothetical protein